MDSHKSSLFRLLVTLLLSVMLMAACSGSNEPQTMAGAQAVMEENTGLEGDTESIDGGAAVIDESVADTAGEPVDNMSALNEVEPENTDPVVSDPIVQNRTQVNFEIMVPAYQSDALLLRLIWGDAEITANWVGDEFWSASADFPTETEHSLTVTFYDNNGDIELGRYEQIYRTGSDSAESLQITADQFDTDLFDDDGDGVSNLAELVLGNDPTVDEDSLLEIRDSFRVTGSILISVTADLESLLSEERPISSTTQEQVTSEVTIETDIQIDIDGNGTLTRERIFSCETNRKTGIRTHVGNAISWEANRVRTDCDFTLVGDLTNTVTVVDENTRTYAEEVEGRRFGTFTNSWETSTNLTGHLVEGTNLCKPVSGTYFSSRTTANSGIKVTVTSITKDIDDRYWRVEEEITGFTFISGVEESTLLETSEYFVRDLHFSLPLGSPNPDASVSENPELFICNFVDI